MRSDFGGGLKIDAGQAQDRLIDDAEPRFNWRLRLPAFDGVAWTRHHSRAHGEIDRHVEDARAFGEVHAEEENVAPAAVGEVHADGRRLAQNRKRVRSRAAQQFRADAERIVVGVAGAKHPLIAAHGAHAAAHLVGEGLEAERPIAGGQSAGDRGAGTVFGLRGEKDFDGFFEAALEQVLIAGERE